MFTLYLNINHNNYTVALILSEKQKMKNQKILHSYRCTVDMKKPIKPNGIVQFNKKLLLVSF